jgi:hypothetical protein
LDNPEAVKEAVETFKATEIPLEATQLNEYHGSLTGSTAILSVTEQLEKVIEN